MAYNKIIYGGKTLIDLTGDTVTADRLLKGATAHDMSGEAITGTCTFDSDTSNATAVVAEILAGKTAYARGSKVTGINFNIAVIEALCICCILYIFLLTFVSNTVLGSLFGCICCCICCSIVLNNYHCLSRI